MYTKQITKLSQMQLRNYALISQITVDFSFQIKLLLFLKEKIYNRH